MPGPRSLPAYAGLGHWVVQGVALDDRLELVIRQLSADLSACRWCAAEARHRWRKAFLPEQALRDLPVYATSPCFSERERAALALTEAVARYSDRDPLAAGEALARARQYFQEPEIARLVQAAAGEHFFNPATGALGYDAIRGEVASESAEAAEGRMPWHAVAKGINIKGWL